MKICPHCKVNIEGSGQICPLCQNYLEGEDTPDKWPLATQLKKQSLLYKIQLFIMIAAAMVCLSLDFMMDLSGNLHWSLLVVSAVIAVQLTIRHIFRTWYNLSRAISITVFYVSVLLMILFGYIGLWNICIFIILPILWTTLMVVDLILVFLDKTGNAMAYLLIVFFVNIFFYWLVLSVTKEAHIVWSISLMITAVALIAMAIFKNKTMIREIQKRLSM